MRPASNHAVVVLSLVLAVACGTVTPEERREAERLLAEAKSELAAAKARGQEAAESLMSVAKSDSAQLRREAEEQARRIVASAEAQARSNREAADQDAARISREAKRLAEAAAQERATEIVARAKREAEGVLEKASERSKDMLLDADREAQRIKKASTDQANEVVAGVVAAAIAGAREHAPKDEHASQSLESRITERTASVRATFDTVVAALEEEESRLSGATKGAREQEQALTDGLLKTLVALRRETLEATQALVRQRIHALKAGAPITVTTPAIKPNPEKAVALDEEIATTQEAVRRARAEAARYSGGLIKAMLDTNVATTEVTLAMLTQARLAAKYGLFIPAIRSDPKLSDMAERSGAKAAVSLDASPIEIRLATKGFKKADIFNGVPEDQITFSFSFKNQLPKDVRAFLGTVVFKDLFDREIVRVNLTHEEGIGAGRTAEWTGAISYNMFKSEHQRLLSIDRKDLKTVFVLEKVIYTDGKPETFQKQGEGGR
jgi:hypothetical protein